MDRFGVSCSGWTGQCLGKSGGQVCLWDLLDHLEVSMKYTQSPEILRMEKPRRRPLSLHFGVTGTRRWNIQTPHFPWRWSVEKTEAPCQMSPSWWVEGQTLWCVVCDPLRVAWCHTWRTRTALMLRNLHQTSLRGFYDNQDITDRLGVYDILLAETEMTRTQKSPLGAFLERRSKQNFLERRTKKQKSRHAYRLCLHGRRSSISEASI